MGDKWELAWLMNNALEKYNKRKEEEEMAVKNKDKIYDELVRQIREAGESIIKNAESIAGNEEFVQGIVIRVQIDHHSVPDIVVERRFMPERYVERVTNE